MRFYNTISIVLAFVFFSSGLFAQQDNTSTDKIGGGLDRVPSLGYLEKLADKSRKKGDYYSAWRYYRMIVKQDPGRLKAYRAYAELGLQLYMLPYADSAYTHLAFRDPDKIDMDDLLHLTEVKVRMGEYQDAVDFLDSLRTNRVLTEGEKNRISRRLGKIEWAIDSSSTEKPIGGIMLLSPEVNTVYYAEYSPFVFENRLYFSSYRFPHPKGKPRLNQHLVKVMSATPNADTLSARVEPFNENELHTAHATFSKDGQRMYYSICEFANVSDLRCDLYMRRRKPDGSWGAAEKLPEPINTPGASTTEANVGVDVDGNETLYYMSNREGGKGGKDIWAVEIKNNGFGKPENLKKINTPGDEVTPFYHETTQTLYFSSNSELYDNMGGLDIYSSVKQGKKFEDPKNLGSAINSSYNDVFFYKTENKRSAYFASNRLGAYNDSEDGCCYDIFKALMEKPGLRAITWNEETCEQPRMNCDSIYETTLTLYKVVDGQQELVAENFTPGAFRDYEVELNQEYRIIAKKPYHRSDTVDIAPFTMLEDTVRIVHLYLDPAHVKLIASVYLKDSKTPVDSATMEFLDFGLIASGAQPVKDVKTQFDSHEFHYELDWKHSYNLFVSKPGHTTDRDTVNTDFYTENDTVIRRDLFIERGLMLVLEVFSLPDSMPLNGPTVQIVRIEQGGARDTMHNLTLASNSNTLIEPIRYQSRYWAIGDAEGFYPDSTFFRTRRQTKAAFDTIYQKLYLKCDRLDCYLPITLFFENDVPKKNPRNQDQTLDEWDKIWRAYSDSVNIARYKTKHTVKMRDASVISKAKSKLDHFFQDSVIGNDRIFRMFLDVLRTKLVQDEQLVVNITLKGYASPIANSEYNKHLTARRIYCVKDYFLNDYFGGALSAYTRPDSITGLVRLVVDTIPNGEAMSDPATLAKIDGDQPGIGRDWSVYSVEASKERRLQIIGVSTSRAPARLPESSEEEDDE